MLNKQIHTKCIDNQQMQFNFIDVLSL